MPKITTETPTAITQTNDPVILAPAKGHIRSQMWGNAILGCSTGQIAAFLNYQVLTLLLDPIRLSFLALSWGILVMSAVQGNYLRPYTRPAHRWLIDSVSAPMLGYLLFSLSTNQWELDRNMSFFVLLLSSIVQTRILAQTVGNAPLWVKINMICWQFLSLLLW